MRILKKSIVWCIILAVLCFVAVVCYFSYVTYMYLRTPAPRYEHREFASSYAIDDINSRVSNGPNYTINRDYDYSITITDKFIYGDGFAPYLIINVSKTEVFTTFRYAKDNCNYSPDGGWFCDRLLVDTCIAPKITKVQADKLLNAYLSYNGNDTIVPLPKEMFSPFDIYVIRKDKNLDASVIHIPKLSVRLKKSTVSLIQEIENIFPEVEKLFSSCRNRFDREI
ncbi:MAG: hypothetical protein J6Q11_01460 [Fibrobacteraceae bacterium]|nr:hypothetical protein [Fibrobacteraceae bacterium]